ncbi:uncharacterized protein LOC108103852 [Drosophila eugracilis]|uniref:uncharacterized protein LOC108103852 n=1 Tax=Drosophila eugracilis TaxID=29029 RepID=UPI0007E88925|nr:uncharacterized protein LOC108103852 [Drosophila eugracilis]
MKFLKLLLTFLYGLIMTCPEVLTTEPKYMPKESDKQVTETNSIEINECPIEDELETIGRPLKYQNDNMKNEVLLWFRNLAVLRDLKHRRRDIIREKEEKEYRRRLANVVAKPFQFVPPEDEGNDINRIRGIESLESLMDNRSDLKINYNVHLHLDIFQARNETRNLNV